MGLCLYLKRTYNIEWLTPLQGAIAAALISAFLIGWIHLKYRQREDTVIAAIWSTGMAIGVIFISLTPGYNVELMNFLFGNILWVSQSDLWTLLSLDALVIITTLIFHLKFLAVCFDEQQATLQGLSVNGIYFILLSLIAISTVILIHVVGAILVIAMLAIPAAIAGRYVKRLAPMMILAVLIGFLCMSLGLLASFQLNWPPGATIALIAALFYLASLLK
jgi:zinc transport system permease protein